MNLPERANQHYYKSTASRPFLNTVDVNGQINTALQSINIAMSDHASRLDSIFMELNDIRGFYQWITDTYPEHLQQYRALLDLREAGK